MSGGFNNHRWLADQPFFIESMDKVPWDSRKPTAELGGELFHMERLSPARKTLAEPSDELGAYILSQTRDAGYALAQLRQEASSRAQMHDQSVAEIDYQITQAASSLEQFSNWGIGYNTGVDVKRNFLERELSNLRKERRSLLVRTWDDIGRLRKEFRQLVREYKAMLSRLDLL